METHKTINRYMHAIEVEYVREQEAELEPEEVEDRKAEQLEKDLRRYIKGDL
jgi:hypothetical protein